VWPMHLHSPERPRSWGNVGSTSFDKADARVVCRSLGLPMGGARDARCPWHSERPAHARPADAAPPPAKPESLYITSMPYALRVGAQVVSNGAATYGSPPSTQPTPLNSLGCSGTESSISSCTSSGSSTSSGFVSVACREANLAVRLTGSPLSTQGRLGEPRAANQPELRCCAHVLARSNRGLSAPHARGCGGGG
jgi:hypothetical protein